MYLILIAWLYVTLMMAIAEATNPVGSLLGAVVTFVLYGLMPMGILAYIMGTPERKRRLKARREEEQHAWQQLQTEHGIARQDVINPSTANNVLQIEKSSKQVDANSETYGFTADTDLKK